MALGLPNDRHSFEMSERGSAAVDVSTTLMSESAMNLHPEDSSEAVANLGMRSDVKPSVSMSGKWPTQPCQLGQLTILSACWNVVELAFVLTPLAFIGLAIAARTLHERPVEEVRERGERVEALTKLGPTIFPVLFVALASRSMKIIATFLTQRGARLGTLELLLASQSVWGTFASQFSIQRLTVVGVHLLLLWSLSPLGGQASLRLVKRDDKAVLNTTSLKYLHTGLGSPAGSLFQDASIDGYMRNLLASIDMIYASTLMASEETKISPRDNWGNVRIPRLEDLEPSQHGSDEWRTIPAIDSPEQHSSLLGVPVVGLAAGVDTTFNLETSYLSLECLPWSQSRFLDNGSSLGNWSDALGQVWIRDGETFNKTIEQGNRPFYKEADTMPETMFFLDTKTPFDGSSSYTCIPSTNESIVDRPRYISFGSVIGTEMDIHLHSAEVNMANCSVRETHVETAVRCANGSNCQATQIRRSLDDQRPELVTPLECERLTSSIFALLPFALPIKPFHLDSSTPTEVFLNDTSTPPFVKGPGITTGLVDLSRLPPSLFSRRLSLVLNTYYQASLATMAFSGDVSANLSLYVPDFSSPEFKQTPLPAMPPGADQAPFLSRSTNASVSRNVQIYTCDFVWLSLLLVSSTILLLVGLVGSVLQWCTLAPDMLGYVTSLTYNNPYFPLPEGGGALLDGMARARALKDVQVLVGDVRGHQEVGHVAFTTVRAEPEVRQLEKGRLYC